MGKVINYLAFIAVLILILNMAGISVESPTGFLLGFLTDPNSWATSTLFVKLAGLLALAGTAGIIIGTIKTTPDITFVKAPLVVFLISIGWDIIGIYNLLRVINPSLALLLTAPLAFAYGIGIIEWWTGAST